MYDLGSVLPATTLPAGTNLLATGIDPDACTEVAERLVAAGLADGQPAVVVSTADAPTDVRSRIGAGEYDAPLAVVSTANGCESADDELTRCIASQEDFSSVGLACSELLDRVEEGDGVRVAIDGVADLLAVADVNTVFRFLHVLTGRIASAGGLGVATLRTDRHDEQTCNTVGQLFDARIELRSRSDARELRLRGADGVREEWTEF